MTTTGLLVGLILEFLSLTAQTAQFPLADLGFGVYKTWFLCGSLAVGSVNLVWLITAQKQIDNPETPNPIETVASTTLEYDRAVPSPHFTLGERLHSVRLSSHTALRPTPGRVHEYTPVVEASRLASRLSLHAVFSQLLPQRCPMNADLPRGQCRLPWFCAGRIPRAAARSGARTRS